MTAHAQAIPMTDTVRKQKRVWVITRGGLWQWPFYPIHVCKDAEAAGVYLAVKREVLQRDGWEQLLFDNTTLRMTKLSKDGSFDEVSFLATEVDCD